MAVIRVPEEAKPLLPLCRKHECGPTELAGPPCFETYADLLVFAASCGFAEMNGRAPNRKPRFLERPNPIDFGIFMSERRHPQILMIALGASQDRDVVRADEIVCRLIEDFAAIGSAILCAEIGSSLSTSHQVIAAKICKSKQEQEITI